MRCRTAVAFVALISCRSHDDRPPPARLPPPPPPKPAAGPDPWVQIDAPADTPEARRKRAEAALGQVGDLKPRLAKLRELAFVRDVPTEYQDAAAFRASVEREMDRDLPAAKATQVAAALAHVGLLAQP